LNPSDSETRDALSARLRFYRDLGIGEFYRRESIRRYGWPSRNRSRCRKISQQAEPRRSGTAIATGPTTASFQDLLRRLQIAPRKPFPAAPPPRPALPPEQHFAALKLIREEIGDCTRCKLAKGRNKIVFGDGDPNAKLMFVGEGPGADEDASGLPFVGRGGQLLNNMIVAMGLKREQVYIAKCSKVPPSGQPHS
jgi:hypothetical protein